MPMVNQNAQQHHWSHFLKRRYYIGCKEHTEKWIPKRARPALTEIVNGAGPTERQRQSRSYGGYVACSAHLCQKGACFKEFHSIK
jgi:hypothetical protein